MKNELSPYAASMIRITTIGILGAGILLCLEMLRINIAQLIIHFRAAEPVVGIPILILVTTLTILLCWYSFNLVAAFVLAVIFKKETLLTIYTRISRPPFRLDRWLLRPFARLLRWTIDVRTKPTN